MSNFNEFDCELAAEQAYDMTAEDYAEMEAAFDEMDQLDGEWCPEDDIDPSEYADDMNYGYDDYNEYYDSPEDY